MVHLQDQRSETKYDAIMELRLEVLPHAMYSPEYHLLCSMQHFLSAVRLQVVEENEKIPQRIHQNKTEIIL